MRVMGQHIRQSGFGKEAGRAGWKRAEMVFTVGTQGLRCATDSPKPIKGEISMQKIWITIVSLLLATSISALAGKDKAQPKAPEPMLVQAVDVEASTITIGKKGAEPQTYTFDKAFGRVMVNGERADLSKVEVGMKVSITGNTTKATRIDADTYVPKVEKKKK